MTAYMNSNATPAEHYAQHGELPEKVILDLIERADAVSEDRLSGVGVYIDEARGFFPAEDCLQEIIKRLEALVSCVRGDNRIEVNAIIERTIDLQGELSTDADCGRDELDKAYACLDAILPK